MELTGIARPNLRPNSSGNIKSGKESSHEEVGALWEKSGKFGDFFSGRITITDSFRKALESASVDSNGNYQVDIVVFKIDYKEGNSTKKPTHRIVLSRKAP